MYRLVNQIFRSEKYYIRIVDLFHQVTVNKSFITLLRFFQAENFVFGYKYAKSNHYQTSTFTINTTMAIIIKVD